MSALPRVLLVDDEPLALTTLTPLLAGHYDVVTAEGADPARTLLDTSPFDVIVADERMPRISGSELLGWVREHHPDTVRIMLTAYDDPAVMREAINEGQVHRFHLKPVTPSHLRADIDALLEERGLVRENRRLLERLQQSEARYRQLFENANDMVFVHEFDGRLTALNRAAEQLSGYSRDDLGKLNAFDLVSPEQGELARAMVRSMLEGEREDSRYEVDILTRDGERVPVELSTRLLMDGEVPVGVQGIGRDISERRRSERLLARQSKLDPLTGLLNRRGLAEELRHATRLARSADSRTVAALVDCDNFKHINDSIGYAAGDAALVAIAGKLREAVRESDVVARIGGDEFLLLLNSTRVSEGVLVAERARLAVTDAPLVIQGSEVRLTASVGVAVVDPDVDSLEELLAATHVGLARSKQAGKNRVSFENPGDRAGASLDPVLDSIRTGRSLSALSQAIVHLADREIAGREFLTRGPEGPFSAPDALFKLAYEQNVLTSLDMRCFRTTLAAAAAFDPGCRVHVNIFPSTVLDVRAERILEVLPEGIDPSRLCLELSEQQLIGDPSRLAEALVPLREVGVRIALDDVGFGKSSLESLIALEPHVVKIDRHYVTGTPTDSNRRRRLERLLRVLERLDVLAIAEGVESEAEIASLIELGVTQGQGYILDRPAPTPIPHS